MLFSFLNPVGIIIMIMSAAASSFGGLAGFISTGYGVGKDSEAKPVVLPRTLLIVSGGVAVLIAFALLLGPSIQL